MNNDIFKKLKNVTHINERQWKASIDLSYIRDIDDSASEEEITELIRKISSTLNNFLVKERKDSNFDSYELDELKILIEELELIDKDAYAIDSWLIDLYDWADGYSVWVKTSL